MVEQTPTVQVPGYAGVNIQIFNPTVAAPPSAQTNNNNNFTTCPCPCYPANYYTQNFNQQDKKKTEKRDIVVLTDQYIKVLENNLNNQNGQIRLKAAKEVLARFQEDSSRKNDPALNALLNKMLQDPDESVKFIAMSALETRQASGDKTSAAILQNIANKQTAHVDGSLKAENILMASDALMKMSGKTVQKEFEVKESSKNKSKE